MFFLVPNVFFSNEIRSSQSVSTGVFRTLNIYENYIKSKTREIFLQKAKSEIPKYASGILQ